MTTSAQVRSQLIQALTLDMVGPTPGWAQPQTSLPSLSWTGALRRQQSCAKSCSIAPPQPLVPVRFPDPQ